MKSSRILPLVVSMFFVVIAAHPNAWAGCGCDHPAPCPAPIVPAFGSPGDTILLTGSGFSTAAEGNSVVFGTSPYSLTVKAAAIDPEHIRVKVPSSNIFTEQRLIGPMPIKVLTGSTVTAQYSKDLFTYLSRPLVLKEGEGHFVFIGYPLAVDAFGVVNMPFDISGITKATNFAVFLSDLPLEFGTNDVIIYNKDGYNLNLFTLDVDGIEKQWGKWYGATVYNEQNSNSSSMLTYWRHDFVEYRAAHSPGGSHYPVVDGAHPDGTVHVDHDNLNIAISGKLRDREDPENPDAMKTPAPGKIMATIHVMQLITDDPFAYEHPTTTQQKTLQTQVQVTTPYGSSALTSPTITWTWDSSRQKPTETEDD